MRSPKLLYKPKTLARVRRSPLSIDRPPPDLLPTRRSAAPPPLSSPRPPPRLLLPRPPLVTDQTDCPHANAHLHHVRNALKMLQRFGGRNFVIKYEGSFKSSEFECFFLEHVEHYRPEVLKKEINVSSSSGIITVCLEPFQAYIRNSTSRC